MNSTSAFFYCEGGQHGNSGVLARLRRCGARDVEDELGEHAIPLCVGHRFRAGSLGEGMSRSGAGWGEHVALGIA